MKKFFFAFVIFIFWATLLSADQKSSYPSPGSLTTGYVNVGPCKIRYYQKGKGRDVFLVHGLPGIIEDWAPVISELSKHFKVTAIDRPGQGFSVCSRTIGNLQGNVTIIEGVIKKLGLKNVIFVGHSYGGTIALAMAIANPPEISAYVSVAGASFLPKNNEKNLYIFLNSSLGHLLMKPLISLFGCWMVRDGLEKAFWPNTNLLTENFVKQHCSVWLKPSVLETIIKEQVSIFKDRKRIQPYYVTITKPVWFIHGDSDKLVPVWASIKAHNLVRNSRLTILKNTGHMVQFVHPEVVVKAVETYAKIIK